MQTYIVLLRGIHVGGKKKVPMAELRSLLDSSGFQSVQTYIQTGNIVLQSDKSLKEVEVCVGELIEHHFGFEVSVFVFGKDYWFEFIMKNPFSGLEEEDLYLSKLNATFLKEPLSLKFSEKVDQYLTENESVYFLNDCLYTWYGDGFGVSKMAQVVSRIPAGTTRNWNTVLKISEMLS